MNDDFISEQLSVSTAQEEQNYFTGQPPTPFQSNPNDVLPPGTYRVIGGQLYRVVEGVSIGVKS
jgi:hypothetical protein